MPEAPVRMSRNGLVVDGEGWFVVNARASRWKDEGPLGSYCTFEGKRRFPHFGINISVLEPGERIGMYHREKAQEAFLVLAGACTLIVEGQERPLVAWDFFYCAPETEHIIAAAGEESAVVLAVGARGRGVGVAFSTRSAKPPHDTEPASCVRLPIPPSPTQRCGQSSHGPASSSTGKAGYPATETSPGPALGNDAPMTCQVMSGSCCSSSRWRWRAR